LLAGLLVSPRKIELREVETPIPSSGEILVQVKASLTCGTDLKAFLRGHPMIPMPGLFGHEFSGVIAKTGKGVRNFRPGDEIMAVHSAPCHTCRYCKKGLYNLCEKIMDTKALGAFAEYILLPPHVVRQNVFHKPKHLSFEEAAFLEPLSCAIHSVEPLNIKKGDSVLITGAGPMGLLHLILVKRKRAKVAITDINEDRLGVANLYAADGAFKPGEIDAVMRRLTDNTGFDYIFECTGRHEVWQACVDYLRRGGTLILFGGCEKGTTVTYDTFRLHYDEIILKGVFHYTPDDVKKAYEFLLDRRISLSRLISGSYPLTQMELAFHRLREGRGIKYAIIP